MSAPVEDTVSGQYTTVDLYPVGSTTPTALAGMQNWRPVFSNPMTVESDTTGKQRSRRTGPYRVDFTLRRWVERGNTFMAVLKPPIGPDGNYNWLKMIFNLEIDFLETAQTGLTAGSGGWSLANCWITNWGASLEDPYGFVYEDITIMGWVMVEKPWG